MDGDDQRETFGPTSGRFSGVAALLLCVAAIAVGLFAASTVIWWIVASAVFLGALVWAAMLRPAVMVADGRLVLRNILETVRIPLAAIESVAVRQLLVVGVSGRRYSSPAVGRTRRQMKRDERPPRAGDRSPRGAGAAEVARLAEESYGLFVEQRIRQLADDAREQQGIRRDSAEQEALAATVERVRAVPEIVMLAGSALAFVVAVIV